MEYRISALKWRPQSFEDLVGQETIIQTLQNAIRLNRVAHAYLFSGTRGVGKTTMARIVAKALNCESGPTAEPCGQCSFCVEIRQGNCIDVMEIDGASNNGVAEVRDLIDKIQYVASACRYKIYIIDEVHMLSRSAFNALLKTLEEPPERVVFIFATTELIKIPETILSRCQCFEFKSLTQKQIIEQMRLICNQEGISVDNLSLEQIAKNAAGSMRDSQSLLDQVVAFCGMEIQAQSVESILGVVARDVLEAFVDRLADRDCSALMALVQEIVGAGKDLNYFCRDLTGYLRDLLLAKIADQPEGLLNAQTCNISVLKQQVDKFHADELHQMFTVLSQTEPQMKRSSLPQALFEMAVLRMTDVRPFRDVGKMIDQISRLENDRPQGENNFDNPPPTEISSAVKGSTSHPPDSSSEQEILWKNIKEEICSKKPYFAHYLESCLPQFPDSKTIQLNFSDPFTLDRINKEENLKIIQEAVGKFCNPSRELKLVEQNSRSSAQSENIEEDKISPSDYNDSKGQAEVQVLREAIDIFGGKVIR
ncbi:MAG: DNA polymerase III subunit gamma/tau [Nitrospinota bacterium]|nr:DNA polymerase III subunit gamma/tau [Nitrospinota bacterium]